MFLFFFCMKFYWGGGGSKEKKKQTAAPVRDATNYKPSKTSWPPYKTVSKQPHCKIRMSHAAC